MEFPFLLIFESHKESAFWRFILRKRNTAPATISLMTNIHGVYLAESALTGGDFQKTAALTKQHEYENGTK